VSNTFTISFQFPSAATTTGAPTSKITLTVTPFDALLRRVGNSAKEVCMTPTDHAGGVEQLIDRF
jgi:hypothetical protein